MRSRKVSPGLAVMRTRIQSDSTRVPPVTADRSPPDSRMTGADSPVIALSSTDATPSTISPSAGISSPASTRTRSPLRNIGAGTRSSEPSARSRCATASLFALRSVSACALPRPSAIASAKLANSTVSQSQAVICSSNPMLPDPVIASWTRRQVVSTQPTSTTNMTGFLAMVRGCSLRNESQMAVRTICGSQIERDRVCVCVDIRTPVRFSSGSARQSDRG